MKITRDPAPHGDIGSDLLRVCIDTRPLFSGHRQRGIGTYVAGLVTQIEHLQAHDNTLAGLRFTYLQSEQQHLAAREPDEHVPIASQHDVTATDSWHGGQVGRNSRAISLDENPCDLYHATSLEGIALARAYKTVVTLYDLIPLRMGDWALWARHPLARVAYLKQLRLLTRAHHVIAISEATKFDACRLLSLAEDRISVIPLGLDPRRGHLPTEGEMAAARAALNLREPYFLAVASSDRHKNLARVVEAFAAFRAGVGGASDDGGYHLYLVGTWMGRGARRIRDVIRRLRLGDVVQHLPWVPVEHMPALYHGATALVFPSLLEGFGLPALEAMASGTAVITSSCSSLPEVGGDAALYVTPEVVEEITAAMLNVAMRPELRSLLVSHGLMRSQYFGQERMAKETIGVYRRMANAAQ